MGSRSSSKIGWEQTAFIGTEAVARSAPDGYTLLWAITPQIAISPVMMKVPYDPAKDFVPISAVATNRFALIVNAKVPAKTVSEFVDYVRAQPKGFTYAEGGAGSITHLSMVFFLNRAGLNGTNVSYKGNDPALTDVVAGHLPAMFCFVWRCAAASGERCDPDARRVERTTRRASAKRADHRRVGVSRI